MSQRLRLGLIGCGDFGKELGRYFQQVADITALCDVNTAGMETTTTALGLDVPRFADYRQLLAAGGIDAVVITAANFVHAEITVAAAGAGLHVFCEKAMARTVPECWDMVRACQANGVKLMIGHKRRLRPPWARMIELTDEALLGDILAINVAEYCDNRPYDFFDKWWSDPQLSGGFFHMHGVHVIEWFRAMCGDARLVTALYGPQHDERYGFRDIVHATKVGMKIGPGDDDEGLSPAHIRRECERSLERLSTDRVDLYYMHKPDEHTPIAESIEAFSELIEAGKVRHWGLSNFDADQVHQVLAACDEGGWPRPVVLQPPYSLLNRGIEQNLLPLCREEGIAVVPYQVLQGGLLTGKYADRAAPPEGSRAAEKPEWIAMLQNDEALAEVDRLRAQAEMLA